MLGSKLPLALQQYTLQKYMQTCAGKAGLRLVFDEHKDKPVTIGKTVYLPANLGNANEADMSHLLMHVNRSAGHYRYGTDLAFNKRKGVYTRKSILGDVYNAIEAYRVDNASRREFLGDGQIIDEFYGHLAPDLIKTMKKQKAAGDAGGEEDPELNKAIGAIEALSVFEYTMRSEWSPESAINEDRLVATMSPMGQKYHKLLKKGDWNKQIQALPLEASDPIKEFKLAKQIVHEVFDLDPEEEEKKMEQAAQQGSGTTGEGQGENDGQAEGGEYGDGNGKGTWDYSGATVQYNRYLDSVNMAEENWETGATGINIEYGSWSEGSYHPTPKDETYVIDYENDTASHRNLKTRDRGHYVNEINRVCGNTHEGVGLANQVRRLLQVQSRGRMIYGQKRGKFHGPNAHRIVIPNAPELNQKVFRKKINTDMLDVAVTVLTDYSGSMGGSKIVHAVQTSLLLDEALSRALNIPLELLGFSDANYRNLMMIFKSFDKRVGRDALRDRMARGTSHMASNADGDAVMFAFERLIQRKEKRKILIVLSDGQPATSRPGDIDAYTKKVAKHIENDSPVEVVGIGIESSSVKRYYRNNWVIQKPEQLEEALLNVIKRKIIV